MAVFGGEGGFFSRASFSRLESLLWLGLAECGGAGVCGGGGARQPHADKTPPITSANINQCQNARPPV